MRRLMFKVAYAGEKHRHVVRIGSGDDLFIANGATGLNDCTDACAGSFFDAIGEREEGVGGHDRTNDLLARFADGESNAIHAAHLASADAHEFGIAGEDDGVGFNVLNNFPGEFECASFLGTGVARRDAAELGVGKSAGIAFLHKQASPDTTECQAARKAVGVCAPFFQAINGEEAEIFFGAQDLQGVGRKRWGHNGFDEKRADFIGQSFCDSAIEREDATEGGDRIGGQGAAEGLTNIISRGGAARVGMLNDYSGRLAELFNEFQCAVPIKVVVVGHVLAVELLGESDAGFTDAHFTVESGFLMGILAVAEVLDFSEALRTNRGKERGIGHACTKVFGNQGIVVRRGGKNFLRAAFVEFVGDGAMVRVHFFEQELVVSWINNHCDIAEIFRCGAEHRWAADVNIFDGLLERDPGLGDGGFKGVEIDHDEIDVDQVVFAHSFLVFGIVAECEEAGVNFGVKGLHASIKHFREAGELIYEGDGNALILKELGGTAGGDNLDTARSKLVSKFGNTVFVGNADECALNLAHSSPLASYEAGS